MKTSDFFFELPPELIAQAPIDGPRDSSRLLVVDRKRGSLRDQQFRDITDLMKEGDLLVFNDTKVFPGRLRGAKVGSGGKMEFLLLRKEEVDSERAGVTLNGSPYEERWEAMVGGRRIKPGLRVEFADGLQGEVIEEASENTWWVCFNEHGDEFRARLDKQGETPIPPYITESILKEEELREKYQTVYANDEGSAAAPTAGFHFTDDLLDRLRAQGVQTAAVTLHVGMGTFVPVKTDNTDDHVMHSELAVVSEETASLINTTHARDGRVFAVGTTTVRTLESFASEGLVHAGKKWTDIFITPGYKFQAVDVMITNFHLPESTLLMLVSAFAGKDLAMDAYQHAVDKRYRFYSFGDSMVIM